MALFSLASYTPSVPRPAVGAAAVAPILPDADAPFSENDRMCPIRGKRRRGPVIAVPVGVISMRRCRHVRHDKGDSIVFG